MKANTNVRVVRTIQAPPQEVFDALQYECRLREWLCDGARTVPRKGGLFEARWNSGYEARGVFTSFLPPRSLAFTWLGTGEPGETQVQVTLKPVEGGTKITLVHSGFGTGKKWAAPIEQARDGWTRGLDNLKSVLETGLDLRETQQPRLGVMFDAAPDRPGVLLADIAADSPAEKGGLQKGDILTSMHGCKVRNVQDFVNIFQTLRGGQRIKVVVVREGRRRTLDVELGTRPVPEIPGDPAAVAGQARQIHERAIAALRAAVAGLTDEQAAQAPAEGEWSVKQTLAHLCVCEPGYRSWAVDVLLGNETHWVEARLPEQFASVLATTPTVGALLDRFEREAAESRAFVAALTPEHRANKLRYRRIALMLLDFAWHVNMHLEQVKKTIQAIQGK